MYIWKLSNIEMFREKDIYCPQGKGVDGEKD